MIPTDLTIFAQILPEAPRANLAASLALGAAAFVLTVMTGRPIITHVLIRYKLGKRIREGEVETNFAKMGTPTMGGIIFVSTAVVLTAIFNLAGRHSMLLPLGVLLACAILGGIDDLLNLVDKYADGGRAVGAVQVRVAAAVQPRRRVGVVRAARSAPHLRAVFRVVRYWLDLLPDRRLFDHQHGERSELHRRPRHPCRGHVRHRLSHLRHYRLLQGQPQVVTFCFTMVGALFGFLWYNAHPAQVFMGDTGSLAVGAALAVAAFQTGQWLVLPIVGHRRSWRRRFRW